VQDDGRGGSSPDPIGPDVLTRALITGADGFTGRYLGPVLQAAGYEVHGLVREAIDVAIPGIDVFHVADLGDAAALEGVVAAVQPRKVAHLAAIAFVGHGDVDAIYRVNVVGTRHLLEALARAQTPADGILLASSANIYGNAVSGVIDEQVPPAPANDYGVSKLAMEYVAKLYADRLPIVLARPFNYTGVGQAANFLIPKIVDHIRRREPLIELGNLDVARDFSDVRFVAHAYRALLEAPVAGETFNICSGEEYTLGAILDMAREISGHDFEIRVNPDFVRANEVKSLRGDRRKLDAAIGACPRPALRETVRWMLEA